MRGRGWWWMVVGFALEQVGCGLGVLAVVGVREERVGLLLAGVVGLLTMVALGLVVYGAVVSHSDTGRAGEGRGDER